MNELKQQTREEYDSLNRTNWSRLRYLLKSPAHYRHRLTAPPEETTKSQLVGLATHLAILEPEVFATECAVWDGGVRRGKAWDAFEAKNTGRLLLNEEEHARCVSIANAVRNDAVAARYVTNGRAELTALWTHEEPAQGGVPGFRIDCKGRLDFVAAAAALVDVKTTRDASPEAFGKSCAAYHYHTQGAFYADGYRAATGESLPFVFVVVENEAPHIVQVYRMPGHVLEVGREEYRALLQRLVVCREESSWPGYGTGEMELTLPRWAFPSTSEEDISGLDLTFN